MGNVVTGGCLCGRYLYEFDRDHALSAHHCHCKDCRKMTGSGKATIILVPTAALQARGELKTYTVTGADGSHVTRGFCPNCGSGVISFIEEMPDIRFVKAGTLEDSSWVKIVSSFWSSTAEPWSPVDTNCEVFERNPVM
ncbi:MAG TPA: GFA family protein [Gammaproteobacteria bacterium]|nr:GFA family protein [Gammaproteobacteria bacterium]